MQELPTPPVLRDAGQSSSFRTQGSHEGGRSDRCAASRSAGLGRNQMKPRQSQQLQVLWDSAGVHDLVTSAQPPALAWVHRQQACLPA